MTEQSAPFESQNSRLVGLGTLADDASDFDLVVPEDDVKRARLAEFLRSRRERLQPRDVGLPILKRQRSPGLRREDVAQRAGISVTYYTWIEQGRELRLSRAILDDLATALRLTHAEHQYIVTLAGVETSESVGIHDRLDLHPTVAHILSGRSGACALVSDPWFNVAAASPIARVLLLMNAHSWPEANLIWRLCYDRGYAEIWKDWKSELRLAAGMLRQSFATRPNCADGNRVLAKLRRHRDFAAVWTTHNVELTPSPAAFFRDEPFAMKSRAWGDLFVHRINVNLPTRAQSVLTIISPGDDETFEKFERLNSSIVGDDLGVGA
jgi:transcriptional regulator with XRE-family HTH domain